MCAVALYSYFFVMEQRLQKECLGDKLLLRKKKRGSAYTDAAQFIWSKKTWSADCEDTPYTKLTWNVQ